MKIITTSGRWALILGVAWFFAQSSFAAVQTSENFDTNWPGAPWSASAFANVTNPASGWLINSNSISASGSTWYTTPSNSCFMGKLMNGQAWLKSPYLTNGIGSVFFDAKGSASFDGLLAFESSYDGTSWLTNLVTTNRLGLWTGYTNTINSMSNHFLRIRRLDNNNFNFPIDTVRITYPTPLVTISNLTASPARPTDQDPVTVSANIFIQSVADTFAITNYWREWPSNNWNLIAMSSNAPSLYTSDSNIPGKSIGALIEYHARATYTADGATYTTNSITNNYVVLPNSSYTNLAVTGQVAATLRNGANYQWQGVIQVTNINPTFNFQGISNAVITTWGDVNQSITNIPLYGQAEVTPSNITLYTTNAGDYLFSLTETNLDYSIRSCSYENFDNWTNADTFTPPHTNSAGWILFSGNTSNDSSRVFAGAGRSAIVETNGWVQSPYLTNGVGQISFWYRNWQTAGSSAGSFQIQTSSNAINWTILANGSLSNIISTNYLFFSVAASDPVSKYVRILNTNTTTRLCLDEVAIVPPGAGVIATNLGTTPANPTILDPISISVDLTPYNGAVISNNVTAWYRVGTNGIWETVAMTTTDGVHYVLSSPITGVPTGTLQYAVQYFFTGFQASSPAFFPAGGTNSPNTLSVSMPVDNRQENFDTNWPGAPWSATLFANATNPVSGWSIRSNSVAASGSTWYTTPSNSCFMGKLMNGQAWLKSPYLTNGIGSVLFDAKGSASFDGILSFESSYDGTSWSTNLVTTNRLGTWLGYTNTINSISNHYLRIRRLDNNNFNFPIDTVRITYPPANVAITNILISPGYPVAGQAFTASCDVITLNPYFPAYNIAPVFSYWTVGGITTVPMIRSWVSGTTNHYTLSVSLGSVTRDTLLSYYLRATFSGQYGSTTENQSPRTSATNTFIVRAYSSSYMNIAATINGNDNIGRLLTNGLWQSVVSLSGVTNINLSFNGYGFSLATWGNSNNWQSAFPLSDTATLGTNQSNLAISNAVFDGQYVIRFNELTRQYFAQKCLFQNFDAPGYDTGGKYVLKGLSTTSTGSGIKNFNAWPTNTSQSRVEDFIDGIWETATNAPEAFGGGPYSFLSWYNTYSNSAMQSPDTVTKLTDSYFVQASHWDPRPSLDGIGSVICTFRPSLSSTGKMSLYYTTTNGMDQATDFTTSGNWKYLSSTNNIINATQNIVWTNQINTNLTLDIIFAPTSKISMVKMEVRDWYGAENGTNGWIAHQSWIEVDPADTNITRCRFETSRAKPGIEQGLESPIITGGVSVISFDYSGLTTNPVGFTLQACYTNPADWNNYATNLAVFSNVVFTSPSTYSNFNYVLMSSQPSISLRLKNTTPTPGALLLKNFTADGFATTNDWYLNNGNVDYMSPAPPLSTRQFYIGACFLNSNYVDDVSTGLTNKPNTNVPTCIKSPALSEGIGEISFWYRNWALTNTVAKPACILIQKSSTGGNTSNEWTTITTIAGITNTSDYLYYRTDLYDTSAHYVRICNDFTYSTNVGRICLDDILITAPWASSLALTNLFINPQIPLYSERVDVGVDVCNLFYQPAEIVVSAYYAYGTNYNSMTSALAAYLPMSCISTSMTSTGPRYRYQTQGGVNIPTKASDTFVRYGVSASFTGYHTEATSPKVIKQFTTTPSWYAPLPALYGTSTAFYVVFSCPTGSVWFNEFNIKDYVDYGDPYGKQYIELCGKAGTDIQNWLIQIRNSSALTQAVYSVTTNTTFGNSANGYGFWVLGTVNVGSRSQILTNRFSDVGGFRLMRPSGIIIDSLSYATSYDTISTILTNQGFPYVGFDDDYWYEASVELQGTNGTFNWVRGQSDYILTPGLINNLQFFINSANEPTILIYAFSINSSNVSIECSRASNWYPAPWYSTNLLSSNLWSAVSGASLSTNATNYVIRFTPLPNMSPVFYKVVTTNGP